MAALRCFFAIKINLVECIPCGQYILADRFLRNSGYLLEHEVLLTPLGVSFHKKESFEKPKNTEVRLNLTLNGGAEMLFAIKINLVQWITWGQYI